MERESVKKAALRDAFGRYLKNHGAPGPGTPKATPEERAARAQRRRATKAMRDALDTARRNADDIMRKHVELAKEGDVTSAALVLARVLPPTREMPPIPVPGLSGDPRAAATAVLAKVEQGELSAERAEILLSLVARRNDIEITSDLLIRLAKLRDSLKAAGFQQALPDFKVLPA
jgi:hypothetical protein